MLIALAVFFGASALTAYSTSLSERPQRAVEDRTSAGKHLTAPVYFRQGRSNIDRSFMGNQARIDTFLNSLRRILADTTIRITDVTVTGLASVEGKYARNRQLAGQRAEALANLLVREGGLSKSLIQTVNGGENWDGLRAMVEASSDIPDKQAVLDIFKRKGFNRDSLKYTLMYYKGGRAWMYMYEKFFPTLRTGAGGIGSERQISMLGKHNLQRLREVLLNAGYDSAMLERLGLCENLSSLKNTDVEKILNKLKDIVSPEEYERLSLLALEWMLLQSDEMSDINWKLLREYIAQSDIEGKDSILLIIDNVPAAAGRERELRRLNGGWSYREIERLYPELLVAGSGYASREAVEKVTACVARLQRMLVGSGIKGSRQLAASLVSAKNMTEQQKIIESLRKDPRYKVLVEKAGIPDASVFAQAQAGDSVTPGRSVMVAENWRRLKDFISASGITEGEKRRLLEIIDNTADPFERFRKINQAASAEMRNLIKRAFFSDLLYGLSSASRQNWEIVEKIVRNSDFEGKEEVLKIIREYPAGLDRIEALRRLNGGKVWNRVRELVMSSLLLDSEKRETLPVSGISLTFESASTGKSEEPDVSDVSRNVSASVDGVSDISEKRIASAKTSKVSVDITTDLVRDAGVQPGFIFGGPTPNLSLGINFAGHLAIQVSAAYCNWNALTGDKGLFAVTGYGGEIRYMFGKKYRYNGIYTGLCFTMGDFDVQEKDLTRGDTGTYWNAGISAGYLLRLGGFIMDFGVRLGYSSASCDGYLIGHGNYEGHFYREGSFTEGKFSPAVRIGIGYRFGR